MSHRLRTRRGEADKPHRLTETNEQRKPSIRPGRVIRYRRELLGWKAVELARRAGLNPGTYDAIEKGRIESPSLRNLRSIAQALGVSVASFFAERSEDGEAEGIFVGGNQKGQQILDFPKEGFRVVCYTPFVPNIFIGKVIVKGETSIEHKLLPTSGLVFAQTILGKLALHLAGKECLIREGSYAFFDGSSTHFFENPNYKESTFLMITTPSFLSWRANR